MRAIFLFRWPDGRIHGKDLRIYIKYFQKSRVIEDYLLTFIIVHPYYNFRIWAVNMFITLPKVNNDKCQLR